MDVSLMTTTRRLSDLFQIDLREIEQEPYLFNYELPITPDVTTIQLCLNISQTYHL